jgi:hypothetical protein
MNKRNWVLNPYYKIKKSKAKTLYVHDANKVYDKKKLDASI